MDDRRQMYQMLDALPVGHRVEFLRWCCRQCPMQPVPSGSGSTEQVYNDLILLFWVHGLRPWVALRTLHDACKSV